jgi:hypothetical protein
MLVLLFLDSLRLALRDTYARGADIETVFAVVPAGSPVRSFLAQVVMSDNTFKGLGAFRQQEIGVDGYAAELLVQLRASFISWKWHHSFQDETRG